MSAIESQSNQYPVQYLSFSSCRKFMSNEFLWFTNYVRGIWRELVVPNMLIGSAGHKHLELHYTGNYSEEECKKYALKELAKIEDVKEYQSAVKDYLQAVEFWFAQDPNWGEVIATELKIKAPLTFEGLEFPLPLMAVTDVVTRKDGKLHIHDYKFVSAHKAPDLESPDFILQAMFNYYTIKHHYGEAPETFTFWMIKKSKNREKDKAQVIPYSINFAEKSHYEPVFISLIRDIHMKMAGEKVYLPNVFDMMSGKESWDEYLLYLSEQ